MSGTIRRRGKRSWQLQIELGTDPVTGRRRRKFKSVKGTRKDAERALTEAMHQRDSGTDLQPTKVTVAEYLERWLRDYATPNVAPSTLLRYQQLVARVSARIGQVILADLRPAHIQSLYAELLKDGLAARTVHHHHRVLREALHHAVRWQLLARNPADAATPPRPQRKEMKTLTATEVSQILAACSVDGQRRLVYFAIATGLRLGEILGLKWHDVDLASGQSTILRSFQYLGKAGTHFRPPKTGKGRRAVALSADTIAVLQAQKAAQNSRRGELGSLWVDMDLVFPGPTGAPARPYAVSSAFVRVAKGAGFAGLRFHDLRHTAATLMLKAGVHPKIVSERLGHSTISITLDTYSHVLPDMQADAAAALDRVLNEPSNRA